MSITYKIQSGDTFDKISRKLYGTEQWSNFLQQVNPGFKEPLTAGTILAVPDLPGRPRLIPQRGPAQTEDEVAIMIEGERFRFWNSARWTRTFDAFGTIELSAPFEAGGIDFQDIFRPLSYKQIEVTVGGEPQFTGTMIDINPQIEGDSKTVQVSGYALPGVLEDCEPPFTASPLEFVKMDLQKIAGIVCGWFGLTVEFEADPGPAFDKVAIKPDEKVHGFLAGLAQQRNLVISDTARGAVLFRQSEKDGSPETKLIQGQPPLLSVDPQINPREFFSHITGRRPAKVGKKGSRFSVKNPKLDGVIRPHTFAVEDAPGADIKAAVFAKSGRMFANAASYGAAVSDWRSHRGNLWRPGMFIDLSAPDAMIYNGFRFLLREAVFSVSDTERAAALDLTFPEAFSGDTPRRLPWD